MVGRLREHHVEAVHEHGVDGARVRDDLDDRVGLRTDARARADEAVRAPRDAAVARDLQHDVGKRALVPARRRPCVAGGQQVDVRRVRVGRDRGLPVVGRRRHDLLAGPSRRRGGRGLHLRLVHAQRAGCLGLLPGLESLGRLVRLLLGLGLAAALVTGLELLPGRVGRTGADETDPPPDSISATSPMAARARISANTLRRLLHRMCLLSGVDQSNSRPRSRSAQTERRLRFGG